MVKERMSINGRELDVEIEIPEGSRPIVVACHGYQSNANSPKTLLLRKRPLENGIGVSRATFPSDLDRYTIEEFWEEAVKRELDIVRGYNPTSIGLYGSSRGGLAVLRVASYQSDVKAIVTVSAPFTPTEYTILDPRENTSRISQISHLLVIHGTKDETVPYTDAERIYELAKEPKKLLIVRDADHSFSNPVQKEMIINKAVQWFKQYLVS